MKIHEKYLNSTHIGQQKKKKYKKFFLENFIKAKVNWNTNFNMKQKGQLDCGDFEKNAFEN